MLHVQVPYAHQVKPHLSPHTVGVRTRVLAEPFLSPQRRTGWIGQDCGKGIKWQLRHKQCQKLGGSRNADLTEPQGVTPV